MKKKTFFGLLLALILFHNSLLTVSATESESQEETLYAPYFVIQNEDAGVDSFPLKSTDVTTNINGIIAETYVVQTYANEGTVPINARYVFPTRSEVTVHGMTLEIGNNKVTATIKEKEEAKKTYETAKSEGKSASLLTQERPNVFTMDVANIMPGDTAKVTLHYTELITPTESIYEFRFPTVVGPRYVTKEDSAEETSDWTATPYLPEGETPDNAYNITVNLSTGVPLAEVTSKSHEIAISQKDDTNTRITLANPADYAGNRDFVLNYKLTGEAIQSGLVLTEGEDENFFMLTVQPPERFTTEEIPAREYIFILDVSGSMSGYPINTAKDLIRNLTGDLRETDTFNIILFSGASFKLSEKSIPATKENITIAMNLVDQQSGYGGTALSPAVEEAIRMPKEDNSARSIVVITDGYVSNEKDIFQLISDNMDTAGFFSFGIGSSVNDYLIEGIAKAGLGEAFIVTDSADAADTADRFRTYIESPLMTDITLSYEGFDVYDVEPSLPSILYAKQPIVLFGKWKGDPTGTIRITGQTPGGEYIQEIAVDDTDIAEKNDAIRYLWARTRLDRIAGYGSVRNDASTKEEITLLGLKYNMTTPYTSFVAVLETIRNPEAIGTDVHQASPLPLQVSNLAIGGGYTAYSEPGTMLVIALLFLLGPVIAHRRRNNLPINPLHS